MSKNRKRVNQIKTLVGVIEHTDHGIITYLCERDAAPTCLDEVFIHVGSVDPRIREAIPIPDHPPAPAAKIEDVLEISDWRSVPFKGFADAIEPAPSKIKKGRDVGRTGH